MTACSTHWHRYVWQEKRKGRKGKKEKEKEGKRREKDEVRMANAAKQNRTEQTGSPSHSDLCGEEQSK